MVASATGPDGVRLQFAHERAAVPRLHDGRFRPALGDALQEPDIDEAVQLVAGALPSGRDCSANR